MPRTALIDRPRRENEAKDFYKSVLDELNSKRGRERKTNQQFADELGVSGGTWSRWNNGHIDSAEFGHVLDALLRAGFTLEVVKR